MKELKMLWKYKINSNKEPIFKFEKDFVVVALENKLYCFKANGLSWKKTFSTTFYRDPYSDVKITALDARDEYIAVGTNFMDGKLHFFKGEKKLWEHQFATIASLGWRPEDVVAVTIGKGFVAAVTQFMHTYLYAYDFNRKRLINKMLEGDVISISADKNLAISTEKFLYIFTGISKLEPIKVDFRADNVVVCGNTVFASNTSKTIVIDEERLTLNTGGSLKSFGDYIFVFKDNLLKIFVKGEEKDVRNIQTQIVEEGIKRAIKGEIKDVFYDKSSKILYVLSSEGCWSAKLEHKANLEWEFYEVEDGIGIGKIGILCHRGDELRLLSLDFA